METVEDILYKNYDRRTILKYLAIIGAGLAGISISGCIFKNSEQTKKYSRNEEPAIIFRLDDAVTGWDKTEEGTKAVADLFVGRHALLDVGVIPYAGGISSYKMPFLRDYAGKGLINISMHGYTHDYMEFDTAQSGKKYRDLLNGLREASEEFKEYFGKKPIAITMPFDAFDENGYKSAQDAGFKIFSSQIISEPYPSAQPVDYHGNFDESGMCRLPANIDVSDFESENKNFTKFLSKEEILQAAKYGIDRMNVAVISIHPQIFVDEDKEINTAKINMLDRIIEGGKNFARITTFEGWYLNQTKG